MQNSSLPPEAMHLYPFTLASGLGRQLLPFGMMTGMLPARQSEIHLFALIYGNDDEFEELSLVVAVL